MTRKVGLSISCIYWLLVLLLPGCRRSQESSVEVVSPEEPKLILDLPDTDTMKSKLEKALKEVDDEKSKVDFTGLQGLWEIVGMEQSELALPGPARVGDPCLIVGDKLQFKHKTWEGVARFKLDATKNPKWIDTFVVEGEGFGVQGIYSLTRDEFKLCFNVNTSFRPENFNTKVEHARWLYILKRIE